MTVNLGIGDKGGKALTEMLKVNTTLTDLNLYSEEEGRKERGRKGRKEEYMTVTQIEIEGRERVEDAWGRRRGKLQLGSLLPYTI